MKIDNGKASDKSLRLKRVLVSLLIIFPITVSLSGCFLFDQTIIHLWTNRAEFAAYIENYNSFQNKYKVEVIYRENPGLELERTKEKPDIVIGEYLNSPMLIDKFRSLDSLFKKEKLKSDVFYSRALALGDSGNNQKLLPLSFNLPAVVFRKELGSGIKSGLVISLEELRKESFSFNRMKGKKVVAIGYSPLWNRDFLYLSAQLMGSRIREGDAGKVLFDEGGVKKANQYLESWFSQENYGYEVQRFFTDKYLVVPKYKLILENRIHFMLSSSSELLNIPEEKRESLDFRWLSRNNRIPVEDDMLFVGVYSEARNARGALDLIEWLFREDTQEKLVKMNLSKRIKAFGIGNGFSVIKVVNDKLIPRYNGLFLGHIPPESFLQFPERMPPDWQAVKKRFVEDLFPMKNPGD